MICDNDAMWPIDQGFIDIIVELTKRLSPWQFHSLFLLLF